MRFIQANILLYFFLLILGISGFYFAVIWPQTIGFYLFIVFAAMGGLGVATYIYGVKRRRGQLVCPVGSDCNAVITSQYSKFLGISLEYLGMSYYAVIIISYLVLIFSQRSPSELFLFGLVTLTAASFFFSLYLLFVQAFLLRQWCIWCLLSATLSIAIFIFSLVSLDFAVAFLVKAGTAIEFARNLGFVLGMGGATTAMFLFFRFLRDLSIDENELQILKRISELIWLGLAFILVGHFGFYVAHAEILSQSGPFLMETIALFVIAVSGAVLMIIFAPLLAMIPFNKAEDVRNSSLKSLRKPVFITGSIALASWYFAFIAVYLPEYEFTFLFSAYLVILALSVVTSLIWERKICEAAS